MSQQINILEKPTFDIIEWEITDYMDENNILFCQTNQTFQFDKCKGTIMPRSRVLRHTYTESYYIENIVSATIDAGFCGKLVWKVKLSENTSIKNIYAGKNILTPEYLLKVHGLLKNSVQIDLVPFPNNYYNGTNQTDLEPDVIFMGDYPMEIYNEDFMKGFYRGNSEKEIFKGDMKYNN